MVTVLMILMTEALRRVAAALTPPAPQLDEPQQADSQRSKHVSQGSEQAAGILSLKSGEPSRQSSGTPQDWAVEHV